MPFHHQMYKLHIPDAFEHLHHIQHIAATLTWGKTNKNQPQNSSKETEKMQQMSKQTHTMPTWMLL